MRNWRLHADATLNSAKTAVEGARFSLEVYGLVAATTHGGPTAAKAVLKFMGVEG